MGNNAILLQHAYGDYIPMLEYCIPFHQDYAEKFSFDYLPKIGGKKFPIELQVWERVELIINALASGYKSIVWVDTDALIVTKSVDMREACKGIGCIWDVTNQPVAHFNTGAIYIENTPEVVEFCNKWIGRCPGKKHSFYEQGEYNYLLKFFPGLGRTLSDKWNSYVANPVPMDEMVVRAWHGEQDAKYRLGQMKLLKGDCL